MGFCAHSSAKGFVLFLRVLNGYTGLILVLSYTFALVVKLC